MSENYSFKLSLSGNLVENSVDAFDVANAILATGNVIQEIIRINFNDEISKDVKVNINAFQKGSLITSFLLFIEENKECVCLPMLAELPKILEIGEKSLSSIKTYFEVKKFLKGKSPEKVEPQNNGTFNIYGNNNQIFNVSATDFRALQSKEVSKNIKKLVQPMLKESSEISAINFIKPDGEGVLNIQSEEANYLNIDDATQMVDKLRIKGSISKIDKKARSGYIDVGSKRIPFSYDKNLPEDQFETLITSLRTSVSIYLVGSGTLDMEGSTKSLNILEVEQDQTLFS